MPALPSPFEVGPSGPDAGGPRVEFRERLIALDRDLATLAQDVAAAVGPVNDAFLAGDREVLPAEYARHLAIVGRCRDLEDASFVLIAREAPVAVDLRWVVAIVRAITDVERSSKLLVHVTETLSDVHPPTMDGSSRVAIELLAESARRIFCSGVSAWQQRDGLAVNELAELDDEVDRLQEGLLAELYVGQHPVEDVVALALLGRYYERLADHGVALARHISWAITGDRVGQRWALS